MKTKLLLTALLAFSVQQTVLAQTDANGYTTVNLSMGSGYQNRVFFDFSTNQIAPPQPANSWDIAFFRNSMYSTGTRINDAIDIKVFAAATSLAEWDNISISNEASWGASLYNPDQVTDWAQGAFEQGPMVSTPTTMATGWGVYNMFSHHVEGKVIFVLKYPSGAYIKFAIEDAYAGYTFRYSRWNGSAWEPTVTKTIANGNDNAFFNYFSFDTNEKVSNLEPAKADWDLMFTRYFTDYPYTDQQGNPQTMKYRMAGVIQSPNISVAKVRPEAQEMAGYTLPANSAFSSNITTIGHSWKPISGVYSDVVYYIKQGSDYYRMYFISNEGSQTGNMYFKYKKITETLGITEVGKKASFGIYPNPATADKKVTVLYDIKEKTGNKGNVEVYDLTGKKVYSAELTNQAGFYKQDMDLSHLASGSYMVKITYGGQSETRKLIVK